MPVSTSTIFKPLKGKPEVKVLLEKDTETAQYVVWDPETKDGVIIDSCLNFNPVAGTITHTSANEILDFVNSQGIKVSKIIESHAHADHLTAAYYLKQKLGGSVPICIGEKVKDVQEVFAPVFGMKDVTPEDFDHLFKDGETYKLGNIECQVIATPGHTPACMTHRIGDAIFTGDTIFMPDVGSARCDFPKGSATTLYESIHDKLFALPAETRIFVGHDYPPAGRQHDFESTIAAEKTTNKHINETTSASEFVQWREGRDKTLANPRYLFPSLQVNIRAGRLPTDPVTGKVMLKLPVTVKE